MALSTTLGRSAMEQPVQRWERESGTRSVSGRVDAMQVMPITYIEYKVGRENKVKAPSRGTFREKFRVALVVRPDEMRCRKGPRGGNSRFAEVLRLRAKLFEVLEEAIDGFLGSPRSSMCVPAPLRSRSWGLRLIGVLIEEQEAEEDFLARASTLR